MIEISEVLLAAANAITGTYASKGAEIGIDKVKELMQSALSSLSPKYNTQQSEIEQLLGKIKENPPKLEFEITRHNLARWFEIPIDDFDGTPSAQLEPEVLIRHIYLENSFKDWFMQWGYNVVVGDELTGIEGVDYVPDIHARLETLHGNFQVLVNFVCDNPPNTYRVMGLLENIESYAPQGSSFGKNDVFMLVTPFKFGEKASSSIRVQNKQEDYQHSFS